MTALLFIWIFVRAIELQDCFKDWSEAHMLKIFGLLLIFTIVDWYCIFVTIKTIMI